MYGFTHACWEGKLCDEINLDIIRDENVYGLIEGTVYKKESINPIKDVRIKLQYQETVTDGDGRFHFVLPLDRQQTSYPVELEYNGIIKYDTICPDLGTNEIFL